jgi:hypothetical protein
MLDDTEQRNKGPFRGDSKPARKNSKPRQRLEGYTMLYNEYLVDEATQAGIQRR